MPIYTYEVVDTGEQFDVIESTGVRPHAYVDTVDPDSVVWGTLPENGNLAILRVPTAPGAFQGLPTPKFHS